MKKPDWRIWITDKEECKLWLDNYIKKQILRKSADESRLHLKKTDHNLNFANWIAEKHKDEIPKMFGEETFYDWVISIDQKRIKEAESNIPKYIEEFLLKKEKNETARNMYVKNCELSLETSQRLFELESNQKWDI